MKVRIRVLLISLTLMIAVAGVHAATVPPGFTDTLVASGLNTPTAMALAPDGRIFVCQQGGALRVIKNGVLLPTPFLTVTVDSSGERGLLGVAFDPNFVSNQLVYIYYTATTPTIHNRISRFTAAGDVAMAGSETIVMDLPNLSSATNHNGGALHFGPDGTLFVAVGDNANGANAQSLVNASRQDAAHHVYRRHSNRQSVFQPGHGRQPRHLGARRAQPVYIFVSARRRPHVH